MDHYKTKTQLAYERLRDAILAGEYQPGSGIVADQVAAELGVSKVPIREAITRLVGQGWLELRPHVGAVVPELSPEGVLDIALLRGAVESAALWHAAPLHDVVSLAELDTLLDEMDKLLSEDSPRYPILNAQFHVALIEPCPHRQMREMGQTLIQQAQRFRPIRFLPMYAPDAQSEHRAIVEAIKARQFARASQSTRRHIEDAGVLLHKYAIESLAHNAVIRA